MVMSVEEGQKHPDHQGLIHSLNLSIYHPLLTGAESLRRGTSGAAVKLGPHLVSASQNTSKSVRKCPRVFGLLWIVKGDSGHDAKFT